MTVVKISALIGSLFIPDVFWNTPKNGSTSSFAIAWRIFGAPAKGF